MTAVFSIVNVLIWNVNEVVVAASRLADFEVPARHSRGPPLPESAIPVSWIIYHVAVFGAVFGAFCVV